MAVPVPVPSRRNIDIDGMYKEFNDKLHVYGALKAKGEFVDAVMMKDHLFLGYSIYAALSNPSIQSSIYIDMKKKVTSGMGELLGFDKDSETIIFLDGLTKKESGEINTLLLSRVTKQPEKKKEEKKKEEKKEEKKSQAPLPDNGVKKQEEKDQEVADHVIQVQMGSPQGQQGRRYGEIKLVKKGNEWWLEGNKSAASSPFPPTGARADFSRKLDGITDQNIAEFKSNIKARIEQAANDYKPADPKIKISVSGPEESNGMRYIILKIEGVKSEDEAMNIALEIVKKAYSPSLKLTPVTSQTLSAQGK